jgi:hypothetical protein
MFLTPERLSDIMKEISELKITDLRVETIYQTVRNDLEFSLVLRKL